MAQEDERSTASDENDEVTSFSLPPCFMHELRPEYLGYMSEAETADLLAEVKVLQVAAGVDAETTRRSLCCRLRECLPRIYPSTVRDELAELLQRLDDETGKIGSGEPG